MELWALARQVLTSPHLDDKLVAPDRLTDRQPGGAGGFVRPSEPARPRRLRLDDPRAAARFPRVSELYRPEARGRALHFFANHELLAVELMGVCLLAFPEAPKAFRMGVARTLLEEQQHLQMYRARMAELGVELGDVPVGGHFWRVLAGMRSPLEYVAGMSLVFEQANLDHAATWAGRFRDAEDLVTAKLMDTVLEDEIGHVKHGATWFERWRAPGSSFTAFSQALPASLDPVRARGPVLHVEPRRRAGLSEAFITALGDHRASKGRRPRLWAFWPDVEAHAAGRRTPSDPVVRLTADLAPLFGVLGSDDDLVLAPRTPSPAHRAELASLGIPTPRPVSDVAAAGAHRVDEVRCWGISDEVLRRLAPVTSQLRVPLPPAQPERLRKTSIEAPRRAWIARGELARDRAGASVRSVEEVDAHRRGWGVVRVKAAFGASGRRQRVLREPLGPADVEWIRKALREGPAWAEPELDRVADFGLILPPSGSAAPSLLRMLVDARGAYRGHILGPPELGLSAEVARPLTRWPGGGVAELVRRLRAVARSAVPTGPVGVDLLIERRDEGYALQPLVEINARYTMGHIAVALRRRLAPGRIGIWAHIPRTVLVRAGFEDFPSLVRTWPGPQRISGSGASRIGGGVVALNDPDGAEVVLTALSVAPTLEAARRQFGPASLLPPFACLAADQGRKRET